MCACGQLPGTHSLFAVDSSTSQPHFLWGAKSLSSFCLCACGQLLDSHSLFGQPPTTLYMRSKEPLHHPLFICACVWSVAWRPLSFCGRFPAVRDAFGGGPFLFVGLPRPVSPLSLRLPHLSRFPYRLTVRIPGFHPGARNSIPREGGPQANHTFYGEQRASSSSSFCLCVRVVSCLTPTLFLRSIPREASLSRSPLSLRLPYLSRFPYRLTVRIPGFHSGARFDSP